MAASPPRPTSGPSSGLPTRWRTRAAISSASPCRRWSTSTRSDKWETRWPAAVKYIQDNRLNEFFDGDADDIGIVVQGGLYNTTLRGAGTARPRRQLRQFENPDLCAQRHLSAGRYRVRALLRRQEGDPDRRGRPARLHRAERQHHPAPRRHPDQDPRQGHAADGRRIHRRRGARGHPQVHREDAARPAAARRARRRAGAARQAQRQGAGR